MRRLPDPIFQRVVTPRDPGRGKTGLQRDPARSPLTKMFPGCRIFPALLDVVRVPDGTADPADGTSAWFPLARFPVPDRTGQQLALIGAMATVAPTDSTATGGATICGPADAVSLGWGDITGFAAAIVVGKNLPLVQDNDGNGTWSRAFAHLPGIEQNATAARVRIGIADYPIVISFPSGKLADTTINKTEPRWAWAPYTIHFAEGDSLDIALVVRSSQIVNASGANRFIRGLADIRVICGLMTDTQDYT